MGAYLLYHKDQKNASVGRDIYDLTKSEWFLPAPTCIFHCGIMFASLFSSKYWRVIIHTIVFTGFLVTPKGSAILANFFTLARLLFLGFRIFDFRLRLQSKLFIRNSFFQLVNKYMAVVAQRNQIRVSLTSNTAICQMIEL